MLDSRLRGNDTLGLARQGKSRRDRRYRRVRGPLGERAFGPHKKANQAPALRRYPLHLAKMLRSR